MIRSSLQPLTLKEKIGGKIIKKKKKRENPSLRKTNIWIHAQKRKNISGTGGRLTQTIFSVMKY